MMYCPFGQACRPHKAVGLVAFNYQNLLQFDYVNGWDLQYGRRVRRIRWRALPERHNFGGHGFGGNPLDSRVFS